LCVVYRVSCVVCRVLCVMCHVFSACKPNSSSSPPLSSSAADINPIGGICKSDISSLLLWAAATLKCPTLQDIVEAPPTAELRPLSRAGAGGVSSDSSSDRVAPNEEEGSAGGGSGAVVQTDEEDMGMSYSELRLFGLLRKGECGASAAYPLHA